MSRKSALLYLDVLESLHEPRQILSSCRGTFEGLRTDDARMAVAAGLVVDQFNVIEGSSMGQTPVFVDPFSYVGSVQLK